MYYALQQRFLIGLPAVALDAHPTIQVTSQVGNYGIQFEIDGKSAFLRYGGQNGGRGISVAVLDPYTGVRMASVHTFDTWLPYGGPHVNFDALVNYMNSLPNGTIYAIGIADEGGFVVLPTHLGTTHTCKTRSQPSKLSAARKSRTSSTTVPGR